MTEHETHEETPVDATVESPAARAREVHAAADGTAAGADARPARRLGGHAKAWIVALLADGIQIGLAPLFAPGGLAPWNDALDILVAALLVRWLGWHWALLPSLIAELMPGVDLVPTWTAAVWIATRRPSRPSDP